MASTYLKGEKTTVTYTCTGAVTVDSERVFGSTNAAGASVGVAQVAGATGDIITYDIAGVYTMPAVTGAVIAQGETVNWDSSAGKVDDTAHTLAVGDVGDFGVAMAAKAAAATATTVVVKLLPGNGAYATS